MNCSAIEFRPIFYGIFFDNQEWKSFKILEQKFPSLEDYSAAKAIMVPGSPLHISQQVPELMKFSKEVVNAFYTNPALKYLGICFGAQLISHCLGGHVSASGRKHDGVESMHRVKSKHLTSHPWAT